MIKVAVCDDEAYFRERVRRLITEYMNTKGYDFEISCFASGKSLLGSGLQSFDYDIVFLDVNMEEMNGIDTAKVIRRLADQIYIVFVTAYITYALDGYKVNAVRYLLKEEDNLEPALRECLDTVIGKMNYREIRHTFEFQGGKMELNVERILYIESRLHRVIFHVFDHGVTQYYMYDKLDAMEKLMQEFGFCRIHQSYLVNLSYVKHVERFKLVLLDGTELSISRKYYKDLEQKYIKQKGDL